VNISYKTLVLNLQTGFEDWIHKWVQNSWRSSSGQAVKNAELIQYISALIGDRYDRGQNVHLQYVKGHSGDVGNDGADALAVSGCALPALPERDWSDAQKTLENQVPNTIEQEDNDLMEDINWEVCGFRSLKSI
jgi:ribonuclease HI